MPRFKKWVLLLLGTVTWSITMVKSGWVYDYGMGFWGANGHDGVWHISLINSLARGSLEMPVFAGEQIRNYHIGFDLVVAGLKVLTHIPSHILYFQIVPPIMALVIGLLTYKLVFEWQESEQAAWWSTFFVYFGGSWGWLVSMLRNAGIGGESMFWAQQSISTLINPPFALSLIAVLAGLSFLLKKRTFWAILCFGLLTQIKIYAAVLVVGALLVISLWKKDKLVFKVLIGTVALGLVLFLPLNRISSGVLVFEPFWIQQTMMAVSDRLNWPRFYEAMINYRLAGNWPKFIVAYLAAAAIFVVGNLGMRLVAFGSWKSFKKPDILTLFSILVIVAGFLLPTLFVQKGTPWNTIQFTYYSLFFAALLAGPTLARVAWPVALVILGLTLPSTLGSLPNYLPVRPPAKLATEELLGLAFLKTLPPGRVLTYPYDSVAAKAAEATPPRPLYLYETTAYVSAFSNHPTYLEDEVNLTITDYDFSARRKLVDAFFVSKDASASVEFLLDNQISYVYLSNIDALRPVLSATQVGMTTVYENSQVAIWKQNSYK